LKKIEEIIEKIQDETVDLRGTRKERIAKYIELWEKYKD